MINYKAIISKALDDLHKPFNFVNDPNEKINEILSNKEILWYPPYLVICEDKFFMFYPFSNEDFVDESEVREEFENAQYLLNCLKEKGKSAKVFFITNVNEDAEALESHNLSSDFGILHNELRKPLLTFSITNVFRIKCKLLPNILEYLSSCKNLKGKIGDLIKEFSKRYLSEQPAGNSEKEMIKEFMEKILTCDERFKLGADPINFMAEIEKIIATFEQNRIRDHFFHAFNTMMLGFMIIDKFYDKFDALAKKDGSDIVLEFIWILTSLYHDIGYPVLFQRSLFCETYGLYGEQSLQVSDKCLQQDRQNLWDYSKDYSFAITVLDSLFSHITNHVPEKWVFDGFPHQNQQTAFKDIMKTSFVEEGAHGAVGALKLALLTSQLVSSIERNPDREFLYRHIMLASMSILFHDSKVRDCFRNNSIQNIKAEDFPFLVLLTYVDILQDDRRDLTGSSSRPDIFKDVEIVNNIEIVAKLNKEVLEESVKQKLREELEEALSFFVMKELVFAIPEELLIIKP